MVKVRRESMQDAEVKMGMNGDGTGNAKRPKSDYATMKHEDSNQAMH